MNKVEAIKAESHSLRGKIADTLQREDQSHFADEEVQLLKFHGTYQQDDRDQRVARKQQNVDKAWSFMVRSKLPGGALTAAQYLEHDRIAGELGNGTLRITTRQGFQIYGVLKRDLQECICRINESGVTTLGACGDVVRNTTAPAAPIDDQPHRDAQRLAKEISDTFLAKTTALRRDLVERGTTRIFENRIRADLRHALPSAQIQNRDCRSATKRCRCLFK
jgi:sulfite reductase (ferredoxin)